MDEGRIWFSVLYRPSNWRLAMTTVAARLQPEEHDEEKKVASATSRLRSVVADFGTCSVDWQLRIENTRVKLKRLYPKIKA